MRDGSSSGCPADASADSIRIFAQPRSSEAKKRAWFADQYQHPHESKHTIGETLRWLDEIGFGFVKSIPRSRLFQPIGRQDSLFAPEVPGVPWSERWSSSE